MDGSVRLRAPIHDREPNPTHPDQPTNLINQQVSADGWRELFGLEGLPPDAHAQGTYGMYCIYNVYVCIYT